VDADTKKFLKFYFSVAIGVWVLFAFTLGPGDLSCDYRKEYKEDHDRYLQIVKSVPYKRYVQRPELNEPGMEGVPEDFTWAQIDFAKEYETRDAFKAETRRSSFYTAFFKYFNAFLVVWLAWRLGKAPLLRLLDNQIHELRDKIAAAKNAREAAAQRKRAAAEKLERVAEDDNRIMSEAEERLARETAELEEQQQLRLEIMKRELEDRKAEEEHAVLMAAKAELVEYAVDELLKRFQAADNAALQSKLVDAFTADLEKQAS
jgi:F0F1-type ATP synthase membrane subunit b/b'